MLVLGREARRWKVVGSWTQEEGCMIKISDGMRVKLRPNQKLTDTMKEILENVGNWLNPAGLALGDFNGRHRSWNNKTNTRGTGIMKLCEKYDISRLVMEEPAILLKDCRSIGI